MEKKTEKKMSRRAFVRAASASAAAFAGLAGASVVAAQTAVPGTSVPATATKAPTATPTKVPTALPGPTMVPGAAPTAVPLGAVPATWDFTADVVVIGSGATGLPAAIRAVDAGASVIVVDCNYDAGGHADTSGGNVPLGGGTSAQKKYKIEDSPDVLFRDLMDWTIVEVGGSPDYRYNDPDVQRGLADNEAPCYEFLVANGVEFRDTAPDNSGAHALGLSAMRENHTVWTQGVGPQSASGAGGSGLTRPLEVTARKKGVKFLLNYHMDQLFREKPGAGRVIGLVASYTPTILPGTTVPLGSYMKNGNIDFSKANVTVKATKAVIIATGGSSGNVNFRRIFDGRQTEEVPCAASEFSPQDASGELAGMAIGASLWGTANQTGDRNGTLRKRNLVGTRTNYVSWKPESPIFPKIGATGLNISDWQNAIMVNQVGKRFANEFDSGYPGGTAFGYLTPYIPYDWRNVTRITYKPELYADAALAINEGSKAPDWGAGPQWAIFDADAVARMKWNLDPPATDPKMFFSGATLTELAGKLTGCPYQKVPMPAANLEATVKRYNLMVDLGADPDFDKPAPKYKIAKPPFYAAWNTITAHDSYAGLRINQKCQVIDTKGAIIPGLYCGGESAAGCSQHGLGRCVTQGYIAGGNAAAEKV